MKLYPAIDLYDGKAVRLYKGDYSQMTVYSDDPATIALDFKASGAECIHIVDLEGAKYGTTPNIEIIKDIIEQSGLFAEVGGGIRSMDVLEKYFSVGVGRAILGTAAVADEVFLKDAVSRFGDKIAVGVDVKDGMVAIKGWVEKSEYTLDEFMSKLERLGVSTVICTDISKDGAMKGTNLSLYKSLSMRYGVDVIASGGVSSLEDVRALAEMGIHGAIIGKAYYIGAINLTEAIEVAK